LGPLELVTTTRPATTIGPETPLPGSGAFQATFSSLLHDAGTSLSIAKPAFSLPRNCNQSAPQQVLSRNKPNANRRKES
jgi:hypothetical protein